MPLLSFNLVEDAWTELEIQKMLDISYEVVLSCFKAPEGDRYQVVNLHKPAHLVLGDTGLGFSRTNKRVLLNIRTRPRTDAEKELFYSSLADRFEKELSLNPDDLMIDMVVNKDSDWSFHNGEAQFLTGEL